MYVIPYVIFGGSMSGKWVQECEEIVDQIRKSAEIKGQDRLDMVRMIRFTLFALQRSVTGWIEWANNHDIMAEFSLEELKEINKNLSKLVCAFVEYDAKITGSAERKLEYAPDRPKRPSTKKPEAKKDVFYVK